MFWEGLDQQDLQDRDIVFDLDGTLLLGDIGESVFLYFHIKNLLNGKLSPDNLVQELDFLDAPSAEVIHNYLRMIHSGKNDLAYQYTAEILDSFEKDQVHQAVHTILNQKKAGKPIRILVPSSNGESPDPIVETVFGATLRPGLIELITHFKEKRARLWIVSASPQAVVDACGDRLGFHPENLFGAVAYTPDERRVKFPWKAGKAQILDHQAVKNPLYVFGNGLEDLDMLQKAEYPVVMGDGHPQLVDQARKQGWLIFEN